VERGGGPTHQERNPDAPSPVPEFRFFAVIKSWNDEDIIEASVRNALVHGVERVYIVDNGSTDATLERAERAGATVAEVYETETFNGRIAQALINGLIARESLRSAADYVWWLHLDSDEFPEGPGGLALRDYLAGLDAKFRIVGARFVNHLPQAKPEYVSGYHPIDFQPLCYDFDDGWSICGLPHWKHPLQRFDRHDQFMRSREGAHFAFGRGALVEPELDIVTHHFQFRLEGTTRAKLAVAAADRSEARRQDNAFERRVRALDAVYAGEWDHLVPPIPTPKPWPDVENVLRWYDRGTLAPSADGARHRMTDAEHTA
jgi:glycosyltransferase involved in cell wall biosynthesis